MGLSMASDLAGHFDDWADTYDDDVRSESGAFPFGGYDAVLAAIVEEVRAVDARRVLELGIGTGNLAARVVAAVPGVEVWGVDFSEGMLARARQKVPDLRLIRAELDRALPRLALPPFGAVVSSYVLHELPDERKVALIEHVLGERLVPGACWRSATSPSPTRRTERRSDARLEGGGTRANATSSPTRCSRGLGRGASPPPTVRCRSAQAS